MRISATGSRRRGCRGGGRNAAPHDTHGKAGFSLVELLAVILLLGLAATLVVVNMPPARDSLGDEADAFAARMAQAGRESILSGRMIGVRILPRGYELVVWRRGRWQAMPPGAQGQGTWDEGTVAVLTEGAARERTSQARSREARRGGGPERAQQGRAGQRGGETRPPPRIRFDPIGISTPFTLSLQRGGAVYIVKGDANGAVVVQQEDES